jgi:glycosyltransferase involved in cell wall biosynthesis
MNAQSMTKDPETPGASLSRVSVIIPTFNRMEMLADTIRTVEAQSYPNIEIIVVDDGSTDGTRERFERLPNIVYRHQENAGPSAARNKGIKQATGKYLAFLDSDDRWYPDFLAVCVRELESTQAGFAFANWNVIDENDALTTENVLSTRTALMTLLGGSKAT